MQITLDLPHVFNPSSSREENAHALRAMLDCLISINLAFLRAEKLRGRAVPSLYRSGTIYGRTVIWDSIPALYARKFGDCKSLTAALVAEYRFQGIDCMPAFRWIRRERNGHRVTDFHILVLHANGQFEDPSAKLGMGKNENAPLRR